MTRFVQEEKWFNALITYLSERTHLKVVTSLYDVSVFPCLFIEKNLIGGYLNRLYGEMTFSLLTDYQGCKQEEDLAKVLIQACQGPLPLAEGATLFKLVKQSRKNSDKKVRHLSLCYQVFVTLPRCEFQAQVE